MKSAHVCYFMILLFFCKDCFQKHTMNIFSCSVRQFISCPQQTWQKNLLKNVRSCCVIFSSNFQYCMVKNFGQLILHHLLHLLEDVLNLEPLSTHSCFPFENFNGQLLKLIHETQSIVFQIITAVSAFKKLPQMAKTLTSGTSSEKFYRKLNSSRTFEKGQEVEDRIFASATVLNNFPPRKKMYLLPRVVNLDQFR